MTYVEIKKVHLKKGKRKYTARAIPSYAAHPCVQRTSVDVVPSGTSRSDQPKAAIREIDRSTIDHIKKQVKKILMTLFPEQQYPTRTTNT